MGTTLFRNRYPRLFATTLLRPPKSARLLFAGTLGALLLSSPARADRTFVVENHFDSALPDAANYFGSNFNDSQVWLQFLNAGGHISYQDSSSLLTTTVLDNTPLALSSVLNGSFTVTTGASATRVYAALSASGSNPYSAGNPDPFSVSPSSAFAYSLAEFTYNGNSFDTADTTSIDTFAYPTTLTTSSGGTTVGSSGWKAGTQAQQVVTALSQEMPSSSTSRIATPLSSSNPDAARYVGTSLHYQTGVNFGTTPNATVSSSGPGYDAYLGFLQANAPTHTLPGGGTVDGWYLDYSGNGGYSGYLEVTGTSGNHGLTISNVRANTASLGGENTNTVSGRELGTAISGSIVVASNGETLTLLTPTDPVNPSYTFSGDWSDMVIASGDQLYTDSPSKFAAGPIITATGDLAPDGTYNALASTFLATVSSIMTTGLLGSDTFLANPSSNYWFGPDGIKTDTPLFANLWSGLADGTIYWDPYVENLVAFNDWEGYSFPYQDRFSALPGTALNISAIDTMTWQLGVASVPEPSTLLLLGSALALGAFVAFRRASV